MSKLSFVVVAAAVLLSGCFMSTAPLMSAQTADHPFPDGAAFTDFGNCDGPAGALVGCAGYRANGTGSFTLKNGAYEFAPDPGDDIMAKASRTPGMSGTGSATFLLKGVGDGLYVMQLGGDTTTDGSTPGYAYELVRIENRSAYFYMLNCDENTDKNLVSAGLIERIRSVSLGEGLNAPPLCEVNNLEKLAHVFRLRLQAGEKPIEKLEFAQPIGS